MAAESGAFVRWPESDPSDASASSDFSGIDGSIDGDSESELMLRYLQHQSLAGQPSNFLGEEPHSALAAARCSPGRWFTTDIKYLQSMTQWRTVAEPLLNYYTERTPGSVLEVSGSGQ